LEHMARSQEAGGVAPSHAKGAHPAPEVKGRILNLGEVEEFVDSTRLSQCVSEYPKLAAMTVDEWFRGAGLRRIWYSCRWKAAASIQFLVVFTTWVRWPHNRGPRLRRCCTARALDS